MEFMLDTANLNTIQSIYDQLPLSGVTSNPSILKREGKIDFFDHMRSIRSIIGSNTSLHVQVVAKDYEGILLDAKKIVENIDQDVYIKIPVNKDGLKAIKKLKKEGYNITATAVYTKMQAYLAIAAHADYIAPYYNRMQNLNMDPKDLISEVAMMIARTNSSSKILGASFKNIEQVNCALELGAHAVTVSEDIFINALTTPLIEQAIDDFVLDWESIYGEDSTINHL